MFSFNLSETTHYEKPNSPSMEKSTMILHLASCLKLKCPIIKLKKLHAS